MNLILLAIVESALVGEVNCPSGGQGLLDLAQLQLLGRAEGVQPGVVDEEVVGPPESAAAVAVHEVDRLSRRRVDRAPELPQCRVLNLAGFYLWQAFFFDVAKITQGFLR